MSKPFCFVVEALPSRGYKVSNGANGAVEGNYRDFAFAASVALGMLIRIDEAAGCSACDDLKRAADYLKDICKVKVEGVESPVLRHAKPC